MAIRRRRRPLRRVFLLWLLVYGLVVLGGAYALWRFIPAEVKRVIYETYINPP